MAAAASGNVRARAVLTLAALLPYWRFLSFHALYVTDDYFASDIFNGELPGRALAGAILRHGELPRWTSKLCSGIPLVGLPGDPIGVLSFALLPTAAALDVCVLAVVLVAAHGAYSLARRFGADRTGALLAGVAYSGCGYFAAQLKHLSIVSTVAWLPIGLVLLDRAFAPTSDLQLPSTDRQPPTISPATRSLALALFGLVFAGQVLCGFPQSTYICALVYGAFALIRAIEHRRGMETPRSWMVWLGVAAIAVGLGAAAGAVVMLPLAKLGSISDRAEALSFDWATRLAYWPTNAWMFLFPYANGDISNNTYQGPPFFWEDYSYLGFVTFVMAVYGAVRSWRTQTTKLVTAMTLVAYAFVLGRATPIYQVAYLLIPGISMFRFPTRFLIVVELGVALLGAAGLTRLREDLRPRLPAAFAWAVPVVLVALTAIDLTFHQPRQNPIVPASAWLAPPASVDLIRAGTPEPRTFTPRHRDLHRATFLRAGGWADVEPYYEARDLLEPNLGGAYWGVASADCYAGISARWYVDLWGDHNREASVASLLAAPDFRTGQLQVHPRLPNFLRTYGVTHMLSAFPLSASVLPFAGRAGQAYVYRVDGAARVRFVPKARFVSDDKDAVAALLAADFDPDREIVLDGSPLPATVSMDFRTIDPTAPVAAQSAPLVTPQATIVSEDQRGLTVRVGAPSDGFLLLADTFYPGWTVKIDDRPAPLYRANISVRGVPVPAGNHEVHFAYEAPGLAQGALISAAALGLLLVWTAGAGVAGRSQETRRSRESSARE